MRSEELFYIVGVGRSGTTLVMSMLNAHPDIGTPPETHFVSSHIMTAGRLPSGSWRIRLAGDHRIQRLGLDVEAVLASVFGPDTDVVPVDVYWALLDAWREKAGVSIVGDKSPKYVEILPVLNRIAPQARVIHVIRDPRGVFLSRRNAAWSADRAAWKHLVAYSAQYSEGRENGPKYFGERYREIVYERLLADPQEELEGLCSFLGVRYDPAMLDFSESAAEIIAEDERAWKGAAAGPLLRGNADRWRKELTPAEISKIESGCPQPFEDGLYTATTSSRGLGNRLAGRFVHVLAKLYRTRLRGQVGKRSKNMYLET